MSTDPSSDMAPQDDDQQTRQWCMFLHFSTLLGFVLPIAGLVAPIIIWQVKKNEMPVIDVHGKIVLNWIISLVIYGVAGFFLTMVLIGFIILPVLAVLALIFAIIGGIKANNGEVWDYPLTIRFVK